MAYCDPQWNITPSAPSTSAPTASTSPSGAWSTTRSIPLDSLKETVRLGERPHARAPARRARRRSARSPPCKRFSERLAGMPREAVRVVGTNALRVAKNAGPFLRARRIHPRLPHRGDPRARGSAPDLRGRGALAAAVEPQPARGRHRRRLHRVHHRQQAARRSAMESLYMGCVSYTSRYFPDGRIDKKSHEAGRARRARAGADDRRRATRRWAGRRPWARRAPRAPSPRCCRSNGQSERGITAEGLAWLREAAARRRRLPQALASMGLREDRIPVFAGGVAIMSGDLRRA